MVPVLAKAPCDVRTVAGSWDDLPVQGIYLRDVAAVSGLWDVIRVRDQVRVGCRQRLKVAG